MVQFYSGSTVGELQQCKGGLARSSACECQPQSNQRKTISFHETANHNTYNYNVNYQTPDQNMTGPPSSISYKSRVTTPLSEMQDEQLASPRAESILPADIQMLVLDEVSVRVTDNIQFLPHITQLCNDHDAVSSLLQPWDTLETHDLTYLRLVCQRWNRIIVPRMFAKADLYRILYDPGIVTELDQQTQDSSIAIQDRLLEHVKAFTKDITVWIGAVTSDDTVQDWDLNIRLLLECRDLQSIT